MNIAKDLVLEDLYNQIARSEKSTTSDRGLIHMAAVVKQAPETYEQDGVTYPHDIHYYCRLMNEYA